jgi:hypothetical protein
MLRRTRSGLPAFFTDRRRIADLAPMHRLPTMAPVSGYAEAGARISYGTDHLDLFRRAAHVRGQDPEVDDQLELRGLLDGKIGWFRAAQDRHGPRPGDSAVAPARADQVIE